MYVDSCHIAISDVFGTKVYCNHDQFSSGIGEQHGQTRQEWYDLICNTTMNKSDTWHNVPLRALFLRDVPLQRCQALFQFLLIDLHGHSPNQGALRTEVKRREMRQRRPWTTEKKKRGTRADCRVFLQNHTTTRRGNRSWCH